MKFLFNLIIMAVCSLSLAFASQDCFILKELHSDDIRFHDGASYNTRNKAYCTFDIPLALMGFEQKELVDPQFPTWKVKEWTGEIGSYTPETWMRNNRSAFSDKLTQQLGESTIKEYVKRFNYGIEGEPEKLYWGLKGWVESLEISPLEQVEFLRRLLLEKFADLSPTTYAHTRQIFNQTVLNYDWHLFYKYGGSSPMGWFVGWATKADTTYVFALYKKSEKADMWHSFIQAASWQVCCWLAKSEPHISQECFIIKGLQSDDILLHEGEAYDRRYVPTGTYEIPLALIGFNSGILIDTQNPIWTFSGDNYTPQKWIDYNETDFSKKLQSQLDMATVTQYLTSFKYGNFDTSGDPGKKFGGDKFWVSSLKISPLEQVEFLKGLIQEKFSDLTSNTYDCTKQIFCRKKLPTGWQLFGRYGGVVKAKTDGSPDLARRIHWYVGWVTKEDTSYVFAFNLDDENTEDQWTSRSLERNVENRLNEWLAAKETH